MKKNTLLAITIISILTPLVVIAAIHHLNRTQKDNMSTTAVR